MGYRKLITYILDTEPGTSLRAAGWKCVGQAGGLRWTGRRRPEVDLCPAQMKLRWEIGEEAALEEREAIEILRQHPAQAADMDATKPHHERQTDASPFMGDYQK